jgi:hypothetical protein
MAARILDSLSELGFSAAEIAEATVKERGDTQLVAGGSWVLHVAGEGRLGRVWRSPAGALGVDVRSRMSYDQVVSLGGAALRGTVGALIGIPASEPLQIVGVSYMGRAAGTTDGAIVDSRVLASYATFGRMINGLPVVGTGSFVKIGFDTQGNLLGFDFDWSECEVSDVVQTTASKDELLGRIAALSGGQGTGDIEYVECGYFDPGVQGSNVPSLLQPACAYKLKRVFEGKTVVVPAGKQYATDVGWPETIALSASKL